MPNPLCHFEFISNDPAKSQAFYEAVMGWSFQQMPNHPDYIGIETGSGPGGGLMKTPEGCPGPMLGVYFQVDDIDATLAKATENGATVAMPKMPIEGVGQIAVFTDPEGIGIGLFQAN